MPFPDYLLLFKRLGCPGSTPDRGMSFPDCMLLFNRLGCPGSTHGRGMSFPDCLLLFNRLGCLGNRPGRGIPFPDCLLLFSPLHYTQSEFKTKEECKFGRNCPEILRTICSDQILILIW
jgi:hypothetical protein